jgi:hypothetical protein
MSSIYVRKVAMANPSQLRRKWHSMSSKYIRNVAVANPPQLRRKWKSMSRIYARNVAVARMLLHNVKQHNVNVT